MHGLALGDFDLTSGYRESTQSWSEVLRDLKRRGMGCPRLVIGDGHLGIWGALRNVYPQAEEQRCWNHRIVNLLAKLPNPDYARTVVSVLKNDSRSGPTRKRAGVTSGFAKNLGWRGV